MEEAVEKKIILINQDDYGHMNSTERHQLAYGVFQSRKESKTSIVVSRRLIDVRISRIADFNISVNGINIAIVNA